VLDRAHHAATTTPSEAGVTEAPRYAVPAVVGFLGLSIASILAAVL
jgi:hypothetical protein